MKIKVTVLCENTIYKPHRLIGEHGLSLLIESEDITLFDTGQGFGIVNNIEVLGKEISSIERIILSHGHYDHTGGLMSVLRSYPGSLCIYLNQDAFKEKFSIVERSREKIEVPIGIPLEREKYEEHGAKFSMISGFYKIRNNLYTISNIQREKGWKSWDLRLKQKNGNDIIDDPFNDDLSLLLETDSGPVVILGCAHAGLVEILNNIREETGYTEFYAVIGGTHLSRASSIYIEKAILALKEYNVEVIGTAHCTGFNVSCYLKSIFRERFVNASVGTVFEF